MATGQIARIIRAPGRVVVNPQNLNTTWPYGGTAVGYTKLCVLQPLGRGFRVISEGLGEATDVLEASNEWVFSCMLRGWDDDAIQAFFPEGYERGAATRHATFSVPGEATPGASALDRAISLLYVPDDTVNVPAVLIYRGIPDWTEGAEMAFQRGEELGIPVALDCLRDDNGNTLAIGRIPDLALA